MNNKPYRHKGKPLTQSIAQEIISTKTYTSGSSIAVIAKYVHETHEKKGGLPAEKGLEEIIKGALRYLSQFGEANQIASDIWRIPILNQKIFGSGKHWVYLYYFLDHKQKAVSKYESGSPYKVDACDLSYIFWECKIGRADKNPEDRVKTQTSGVPVPPHIDLLLRTDEHVAVEKAIHGILTARGRHLKRAQGKEWFLTNPREVKAIYDFIIRENPYIEM